MPSCTPSLHRTFDYDEREPQSQRVSNSKDNVRRVSASANASQVRWLTRLILALDVTADFAVVASTIIMAYGLYRFLHIGKSASYPISLVALLACLAGVLYLLLLSVNGAYARATSLLRVRETERVIAASAQLCVLTVTVSFWTEIAFPRTIVCFVILVLPLMLIVEKQLIYVIECSLNSKGRLARRTVIYGAGVSGNRVYSVLARSPKLGLDPVAIVDDDVCSVGKAMREPAYRASDELRVLAGPITAEMLYELSAELLIISTPAIGPERFREISSEAAEAGAVLLFVPYDVGTLHESVSYWEADGVIFASIGGRDERIVYKVVKRAFDMVMAIALLCFLSPVLLAIFIAVYATSPGPVLFVQDRIGENSRRFKIYKFRTMYKDAPRYAYSPNSSHDSRLTGVGRFLRRTSLDELPQLLNVLRGDMSLVGPRPEMPFIVEQYGELERKRLAAKPGMTGLWQISAGRAELIHENLQYDLYYIRHCNFCLDLAILLHTAVFVTRGV